MFLHGGWLHVISNMWILYLFGDNVEDRMGHLRFLGFYLLSGLAANLAHFLVNLDSTMPVIGASGAVAGVMAAYLRLFPRARIITLFPVFFIPYFLELPAYFFMAIWFLSQLFSGAASLLAPDAAGGIAWWAHIGGFLVGFFLVPVLCGRRGCPG
jgi:membrane associated rhomboid family serine protease